ncbi:MAG: phosphoribosyltransferase family protein [Chitinophagales bacterium]
MSKNLIIDQKGIHYKLVRMSYQILEDNYAEDEIHLIGIVSGGLILAKELKKQIAKISDVKILVHSLEIDKKNPLSSEIKLSTGIKKLEAKTVILVDDVTNTGKTGFYAFKPLMDINAKSVKMAVLVDRRHKKYPVYSSYVGNKLTTTLQEYISVDFEKNKAVGVYLS